MKHEDGVHVSILVKSDKLKEFTNPLEKRSDEYDGAFGSRVIATTPSESFELVIAFDRKFKLYKAEGIQVVIVTNSYAGANEPARESLQAFWLSFAHMDIHTEHKTTGFTRWTSEDDDADTVRVPMQIPWADPNNATMSAQWMNSNYYCANLGCISICIERGKLTGNLDNVIEGPDPYKWTATDPPSASRNIQSPKPKVVRSEWFVPLKSSNELPYLFEYRTARVQDRYENQPEAHGEIGHDLYCEQEFLDSMEEFEDEDILKGDHWGLADYDDSVEFDELRKSNKRKRAGHQPTRKTRRVAERVRGADCGTRVRVECEDRDDDEDIPEVKVEHANDRSSLTQEPTPPRENPQEVRSTTVINAEFEVPHRTLDKHSTERETTTLNDQQLRHESSELRNDEDDDDYIEKLQDELEAVNLRAVELHRMIRSAQKKRATRMRAT